MEDSLVHLCFPDSETVLLRCHQKKKSEKEKGTIKGPKNSNCI